MGKGRGKGKSARGQEDKRARIVEGRARIVQGRARMVQDFQDHKVYFSLLQITFAFA